MLLGMTQGEIGLVLFIFALIYGAQFLPRVAKRITAMLGKDEGSEP